MLRCGHFSLAPQFDMSPFGWYNRRMEFLGRTGVSSRAVRSDFMVSGQSLLSDMSVSFDPQLMLHRL